MSAFERLLEQKAVALQYSPEKDSAPVIVASGMGYMAEKITEAARKSGVPVYEDDSLCNSFKQITAGGGSAGRIISGDHRNLYLFLGYVPSLEEKENEEKPIIPDRKFRHRHKMLLLLLSGAHAVSVGKDRCFCSSKKR